MKQQQLETSGRQRIYMEVSDRQLEYLDQLISSGLYGSSHADVVRTLMGRGIADAITAGTIIVRPLSKDPNQLELEMP